MSNFFGFQGGTENPSNKQNKESIFSKISSAVGQLGLSKGATVDPRTLSTADLHTRGCIAMQKQQYDKAYAAFLQGACRYDKDCIIQLGNMFRNGVGIDANPKEAWFWGRMLAELRDPLGYYLSGIDYYCGLGVEEDDQKAFGYFEKACRLGYEDAKTYYDELINNHVEYYNPIDISRKEEIINLVNINRDKNDEAYYDACLQLATFEDDNDGKNWVGNCAFDGVGVEQDYIAAFYWFKKAAEYGNIFANYNLANMYATGKGVLIDYNEAIRLYNIAASRGHHVAAERAQLLISRQQKGIDGVKKEFNEHFGYDINSNLSYEMSYYFEKLGALSNDWVSCAEYASAALWLGIGGKYDYNEALFNAGKAALALDVWNQNLQGKGLVCYMLSHMLAKGKGIEVNEEDAQFYFELAAEAEEEYRGYDNVHQYMEAQINASESDCYRAFAYETGRYGDRLPLEALKIYESFAKNNYLAAVFKVLKYYVEDSDIKYDDSKVEEQWKIIENIINNSQRKDDDWAYVIADTAGKILDMYNKENRGVYDYLTGDMAVDISKKLYWRGKRSLAYIGLIVAKNRGNENADNIWDELDAVRRKQREKANKAPAPEPAPEPVPEPVPEPEPTPEPLIIDASPLFSYSEFSDWTPYETIDRLVNKMNLTEKSELVGRRKMFGLTENGPFDEEIKEIRELVAAGEYDELLRLGLEYDEAASEEDISVEELDKNLRLMILCYKLSATHGNPAALALMGEACRSGRGLPANSERSVEIFDRLKEFLKEDFFEDFEELYESAKEGISLEAKEGEAFNNKHVDYYDRYAYYLEKAHYEEEEWLINEYYRRAHEKENRNRPAMPTLIVRTLYKSERIDWELMLNMPWEGILSGKYNINNSTVEVGQLSQSENEGMPQNLDSYFAGMIGMEPVKEQLEKIYQSVKMQLLRNKILEERGEEQIDSGKGYNFILLGNPGTGKTTVARIIAQILYDINIRQNNSFVEIERSGVVSDHVGGTEKRMRDILGKVDGGTLFIDEAYALYKEDSDNDFGREAIDVLMKDMEDKRNSYSVIMAGYREPMLNMIKNANTGFSSRFTYTIELPDYSDESLIEIAHTHIAKQKFVTDEKVDAAIKKCIAHDKIDHTFGNARYIRELVNRAIENQSHRLTKQATYDNDELFLLKGEDFWQGEYEEEGVDKYLAQLNGLVGLESVKQEVESLINLITVQQEMERRGMEVTMDYGTLHMAFKGNPGTGKTTVARIIGKLYASLGVLKRGDVFVECTRADLVGKYSGHTAANVKKVVDSAMGGILFIDEAYALCQNESDNFGHEAVDALVAEIENNRSNFIVIFAGYTEDIDIFFKNNSGLRSRVPKDLVFEDYSIDDLYKIANAMLESKKFMLAESAKDVLRACIENNYLKEDFGNARGVRNIVDAIVRRQNVRIAGMLKTNPASVTNEVILAIEDSDIENVTI